jgi:Flp pilus assembly pilin Flp
MGRLCIKATLPLTRLREVTLWMNRGTTRFARDQNGATALEYGLLIALLAIGLIAVLLSFDLAGRFFEPLVALFRSSPGGGGTP